MHICVPRRFALHKFARPHKGGWRTRPSGAVHARKSSPSYGMEILTRFKGLIANVGHGIAFVVQRLALHTHTHTHTTYLDQLQDIRCAVRAAPCRCDCCQTPHSDGDSGGSQTDRGKLSSPSQCGRSAGAHDVTTLAAATREQRRTECSLFVSVDVAVVADAWIWPQSEGQHRSAHLN